MSDIVKKLQRLEDKLFSETLAKCRRLEAYAEILSTITKAWRGRVETLESQLEEELNRRKPTKDGAK